MSASLSAMQKIDSSTKDCNSITINSNPKLNHNLVDSVGTEALVSWIPH